MALNLNRLNPEQKQAVCHGSGPLLVLAGAGSGKTSTMAYRMARLVVEKGVPATHILGLSFTNKAAKELRERVRKLIKQSGGSPRGLTVTTFHSLCVRILRKHANRIGFQNDFTILDSGDQEDILRQILRNIRIDDRKFDPRSLLFEFGRAKNSFIRPENAEEFFASSDPRNTVSDYTLAASSSYPHYLQKLQTLNAMDFDDLLYHTVRLLEDCPEVRQEYNLRFRYLLVDEYQDTNGTQFRLLRSLTQKQQNICVVGDDDQSIYAWRGADPSHILKFPQHYQAAKTIILARNYRSTMNILEAANQVISKNKVRHEKSLWSDKGQGDPLHQVIVEDDRAEGEYVAGEIEKNARRASGGVFETLRPWKDFAILYRSNTQARIFEEALRLRNIPYKIVGGMSYLDRKEIKDTLSYWRLIANPQDDAAFRRVINWPPRGIGRTSIEALNRAAVEKGSSLFDVLDEAPQIAPRAATAMQEFKELITSLRASLQASPFHREALGDWAKASLQKIDLRRGIENDCEEAIQAVKRWENAEELAHGFSQLSMAELGELGIDNCVGALSEYLNRLTLAAQDEDEERKDKDSDQVTLMTLHGAKGLEFDIVFLVGLEEDLLPHKRVLEEAADLSEERRLCYVGITRARWRLYLTRARNRIKYGKPVPRTPSRFLQDIPKELLTEEDLSLSPDPSSKEAQERHETRVKSFLDQIRANLST